MTFYEQTDSNFAALIDKFWTPILVAIVGYFTYRLNITIKRIELFAQAKLKARELYFESYQEDLKSIEEAVYSESKNVSENYLSLYKIKEKNIREKKIQGFVELHYKNIETHREIYEEFLEKVKRSPIMNDTIKKQVDFVEKNIMTNIKNLSPDKIEDYFYSLSKAYALILKLQQNLIERKRDDLFSEYL